MPGANSARPGPVTAAGDAYLEHVPPAALATYVECFWSRSAPTEPTRAPRWHRVMPDGCVDIVVAFGAVSTSAAAVGAMTRPLIVHDTSDTSYLGVRFRPGVAGVLFGVPASEVTDERLPLSDLWPDSDALTDALGVAGDTTARIRAVSAAIARRLLAAPAAPPALVTAAARRLTDAAGKVSIRALAAELGVTRQHLARSFADHVGLSPKMLARVIRARGVVARTRGATDVHWSSVALDAGYYDQSHLIADVKELTGLSPRAWLAQGT
jgi:AraC-like DNA-binding protein